MESPRAQSNPLAVALLLGIVVTGALTVVLFGGGVIEGLSDTAATERAAQEMTQFASETAAVALGGSDRRSIAFSATEGELTIEPEASWICVQNGSVDDRELILPESDDPDETCDDTRTDMGSAVYDTGDGRVAYEGGGVWTTDTDGNSRMVSPPEFHYRGDTLTLPVVQIDGDVRAAGPQVQLLATAGETHHVDISNPLPENSSSVYVTVGSEFYQAWGRFIAERTDGRVVELDHDAETVTVELVVRSPVTIDQAVYASSTEDESLQVDAAMVDSYDSGQSPPKYEPPDNNGSDGQVVTDGGIQIQDTVRGDVYTVRQGGDVTVSPDSGPGVDVEGDIHSQQGVVLNPAQMEGNIYAEGRVEVHDTGTSPEVDGDIHTDGVVDLSTVTVTGDVYANEGVVVDDDTGTDTVRGQVHTAGYLDVSSGVFTDATAVDRDFDASQATFAGPVDVSRDADAVKTEFNDDLRVDRDLTLRGGDNVAEEVDGSVHVGGDATLEAATVTGDLHVDGDLSCDSESDVDGTVHVGGDADIECGLTDNSPSVQTPTPSDAPYDTENPEEPVLDPPAVELPDESEFADVPSDCTDSGEAIVVDGGTCELDPGKYNVSKLDLDGDNPSDANLRTLTQGVPGDEVELYVGGDVSIAESGTIQTGDPGHQNATELEINVYAEDASVDISSNVTGVVNAPDTTVDINDGAHVHGAIIAEKASADGGGGVHYDEALAGTTAGAGQGDTPTVRYLHVTRNELTVED
jgi:cytoskeletal protein CcmA (bactofilin family)